MALELVFKKFMGTASKLYKRTVANELNKIGLRYEDIIISADPAVEEAMTLAEKDVLNGRMRRLKRASDLCVKQKRYIDYAPTPSVEEVFKFELIPDVEKIRARDAEVELLNLHKK